MEVLKIKKEKRQELTNSKIAIVTYLTLDGYEVDAIVVDYEELYPDFERVEVLDFYI